MQSVAEQHRLLPLRFLAFFLVSTSFSLVFADEFTVASHPTKLQLPPGQPLDKSPGSKPGSVLACNRVHIHGLPRLRHLNRFAHSLKVKVAVLDADPSSRIPTLEICFHRNASIGVGMCSPGAWEKAAKGSWVQSMSPFESKIVDICLVQNGPTSKLIEVSTEEEFLFHRIIFLIMGIIMMTLAHFLSESLVFYYGSAMTLGVLLVILMVLFQGMRLLPTGRKSSLAIFMYSSIVGFATFLLHYLSGLLRSVLVEIGIREDMHNPLAIFFLVGLILAGAWLGFWGVRKLVLDEDGSVDTSVAYFVEWSILIFAAVMILQSSLDAPLALGALVSGIVISAMTRTSGKLRFLHCLYRCVAEQINRTQIQKSPSRYSHAEYPRLSRSSLFDAPVSKTKPSILASCTSPFRGSTKTSPQTPLESQDYYSTFHTTPDKKRFSKEEWKTFTVDSTKRAMEELFSSPDFVQWAATNAERINVTPAKDCDRKNTPHRFHWF